MLNQVWRFFAAPPEEPPSGSSAGRTTIWASGSGRRSLANPTAGKRRRKGVAVGRLARHGDSGASDRLATANWLEPQRLAPQGPCDVLHVHVGWMRLAQTLPSRPMMNV